MCRFIVSTIEMIVDAFRSSWSPFDEGASMGHPRPMLPVDVDGPALGTRNCGRASRFDVVEPMLFFGRARRSGARANKCVRPCDTASGSSGHGNLALVGASAAHGSAIARSANIGGVLA